MLLNWVEDNHQLIQFSLDPTFFVSGWEVWLYLILIHNRVIIQIGVLSDSHVTEDFVMVNEHEKYFQSKI